MTTDQPDGIDHGHVTLDFGDRPFVRVVVPLGGSPAQDAPVVKNAVRTVLAALDVPAEDVETFKALLRDSILGKRAPAPQPPQQNQGGGQRRGGGGRRPPPPDPNAPYCRIHNAPMRRNKRNNGWFCTKKDGDDYCAETEWDN